MTEEYEHIELFGKPALFTNARVDTHTVPDGWHVYDLRGSDNDPGSPCTLEILVVVNHAGSIVVPEPISFPDNQDYREIGDALDFLGDEITLTEFCKQYGLKTPPKYKLRPASREEAGLFYSQVEEERDLQAGTVGHVRMDFGSSGKGFHQGLLRTKPLKIPLFADRKRSSDPFGTTETPLYRLFFAVLRCSEEYFFHRCPCLPRCPKASIRPKGREQPPPLKAPATNRPLCPGGTDILRRS